MTQMPVSRRRAMAWGAGVAVGVLGACSAPARPAPATDHEALTGMLAGPAPRIARRDKPYRIDRPLVLPAGRPVRVEPGTRFLWTGAAGSGEQPAGVFRAGGPGAGLIAEAGGTMHVECSRPSPYVYAVEMEGLDGLQVVGVMAHDCQHVRIHNRHSYPDVRTTGPGINVARNIRISGGGALFSQPQKDGHGSCLLQFVADCVVQDAQYRNVANGVQWWGGNANPLPGSGEGIPANERKCRDIVVERTSVKQCTAGIWGAMGRDIVVRDCLVDTAIDVGMDAEAGTRVTFERCTSVNGYNGCFATFFLCDGVRFVDCVGIVDNKDHPLLRVYNMTQSNADNRGLEVIGGRFECRDRSGPAAIDTGAGPVQTIAITGATLTNVRIDLAHYNMHRTRVANNTLTFPYPLGEQVALRAGASKTLDTPAGRTPGSVVIEGNQIRYLGGPGNATAIELHEDDFNGSATGLVRSNIVFGPFGVGVSLVNGSNNPGVRPDFTVSGNRFDGLAPSARLVRVTRATAAAGAPGVRWDDRQPHDGRATTLGQALGR